ncbi:MAG: hypothetical protein WAR37_03525 [Candidatus Microsaccharimonas sp.]
MRQRECNELIPKLFHVYLPVTRLLFDDIETGPHSYAVLFESGRDTYALIVAKDGYDQTLADVKRIVKGMGLEAQRFFPPEADPLYFYDEGVKHFLSAYPGRKQWKKEDITFYQSLASYKTALIRVASIKGEVRRFNTHTSNWQKAFDYTFKKIQVQ